MTRAFDWRHWRLHHVAWHTIYKQLLLFYIVAKLNWRCPVVTVAVKKQLMSTSRLSPDDEDYSINEEYVMHILSSQSVVFCVFVYPQQHNISKKCSMTWPWVTWLIASAILERHAMAALLLFFSGLLCFFAVLDRHIGWALMLQLSCISLYEGHTYCIFCTQCTAVYNCTFKSAIREDQCACSHCEVSLVLLFSM